MRKMFFLVAFITSIVCVNALSVKAEDLTMTEVLCAVEQNDGSYIRTQYSVSVYTESGHSKGSYSVYLHSGKKYIKFNNVWINIQGKSHFAYNGNWYIIR